MNPTEIQEVILPVIDIVYDDPIYQTESCRSVYNATIVFNAGVALTAQAGCFALDLSVVGLAAGIACHAGVFIANATANYIALDTFEKCKD